MKFEVIAFYEEAGSGKHELGLHLKGRWVPKKNFQTVWTGALEEIPKLDWTHLQTAETISGVPNWKKLPVGYRISLGRCLKFFVDEGMLPLRIANPGKKGTRKYARKN